MIYLIHADFKRCAAELHPEELMEQVRTGYEIITGKISDDQLPWSFYEGSLLFYWVMSIAFVMKNWSYYEKVQEEVRKYASDIKKWGAADVLPDFLDNHIYTKHLLMSHRVYLLRKRFNFYKDKFPKLAKKNLDKYPKGLFYMITDGDKKRIASNAEWIDYLGIKKYIRS